MKKWIYGIAMALLGVVPLVHGAGSITLSPGNESVVLGGAIQYTATVTGLASNAVTWSVNGMPGGNPMLGTITSMGLYTAPMTLPSPNPVTLTATSMDMSVSTSIQLTVKTAAPVLSSIAPATFPAGKFKITLTGSGFDPAAMVYMGGTAISTLYVSPTQLQAGATGVAGLQQFRVVNPGSMFSNAVNVTITAASGGGGGSTTLSVLPAAVTVIAGLTQQFTAQNAGAATTWSAGGVAGGNATFGTISATGLYTAPAAVPSPAAVTIAAASNGSTANAVVTVASNIPPTITLVNPAPLPIGVFSATIAGTGFIPGSQASLGGAPVSTQYVSPTALTVTAYASQNGPSNMTVSNSTLVSLPYPVQIGVANPMVPAAAARRFLEQAAFGPTPAEAAHVQTVGFQGWLNEQFALPGVSNYQLAGSQGNMPQHYLTNAVMNPDQLRQKIAFAYSQIFVTSLNTVIWTSVEGPYQELLLRDAFVNYRQLLEDVTLHPAMGEFLNMANNAKGNALGTVLPNENFAREVLQLFSIGTWMLNPDGTRQVDAMSNFVPTYDQTVISQFAKVFTGWTNPPQPGHAVIWGAYVNPIGPMVPYDQMHDNATAKTLLNGVTLPAGQSTVQDLKGGLDNIFNHANVGLFIGKQLIQHLVKSNPTPAYVARVAAVFNDNGMGVRGDMKAVIAAILLDTEARANDAGGMDQPTDGHMQEPALFLPGFLRALNATVNDQNYFSWDLYNMSQDIFNAPSVFNYYSPNYGVPGFGISGGEFQIYTPATSLYRDNLVSSLFAAYQNPVQTNGPGTTIDLTAYANLASQPSQLVNALDLALTHGTMPSQMKQTLVTAVTSELGGNAARVQTALYLILASSYYNVWH